MKCLRYLSLIWFYKILTIGTLRARYKMSFVSSKLYLSSVFITVIRYDIQYHKTSHTIIMGPNSQSLRHKTKFNSLPIMACIQCVLSTSMQQRRYHTFYIMDYIHVHNGIFTVTLLHECIFSFCALLSQWLTLNHLSNHHACTKEQVCHLQTFSSVFSFQWNFAFRLKFD